MATNRDLLKEAIADAKAVKETAIANAKAALEEAFTPFLKEKLASKIAEMDEVDEEIELEESEVSEVEKEMDEMKKSDDMTEEVSLDELLAELEEESNMEEAKDEKSMEETYMEDESMYEAEGEEEMSIEDMSEDDLKSFIEDVIKDMVSAGELEAGESIEGEEGEEEGGEEMEMDMEAGEEDGDTEIDIDELLAEMEGSKEEKMEEAQVDEYIEAATPVEAMAGIVGSIIMAIIAGKLSGITLDDVKTVVKSGTAVTKDQFLAALEKLKGKKSGTAESTSESELEEAYSTIEELRNELNEINLLNAKLLYTNKIFRNKSLTETQKVHVLTSFDKATTKKEVELVYETLTESLKVSTATKAPIKESLGSASKALGGATSKPIIENDAFARMRELAFFGKNK